MNYKAMGLMCGSSMDGVDMVLIDFEKNDAQYRFQILHSDCIAYSEKWHEALSNACLLSAHDYLILDARFGAYLGNLVNEFLKKNDCSSPDVIAVHGHTTFHEPLNGISHQLGSGAHLSAQTGCKTVSDLRAMDVALQGQGAPLVPLGEKLLFPENYYFLNIGGICNLSIHTEEKVLGFDVCAANRILNLLANQNGKPYDENGLMAAVGKIHFPLLDALNQLNYYQTNPPKSLSNQFGLEIVWPMINQYSLSTEDYLATYVEHIALQIKNSLMPFLPNKKENLVITGGGAFNDFLIDRIKYHLQETTLFVSLPSDDIIRFKEAIIMALLGILRIERLPTTLPSVTGAIKKSVGGALWMNGSSVGMD